MKFRRIKFILLPVLGAVCFITSCTTSFKQWEMDTPVFLRRIKVNRPYVFQKIPFKGQVRWYKIDLDKGNVVTIRSEIHRELGISLRVDLMRQVEGESPVLIRSIKKGKSRATLEEGLKSFGFRTQKDILVWESVQKISQTGTYYIRIFDKDRDTILRGGFKGYSLIVYDANQRLFFKR